MEATINHIRIGEDFFISFGPTVSSLGFSGLPKDVHLSLSYSPGKPLNFHVTRNIGDGTNKPHISICKMDKQVVEAALQSLSCEIFMCMLQPLDISYYQRSHRKGRMNGIKFLSLTNFENSKQFPDFKKEVHNLFRKYSSIKKKRRLKILTSIEAGFTEWAQNPAIKNKLGGNLNPLSRRTKLQVDNGLLVCPLYKGHVIRINDRFYIFRKDVNPMQFASILLGAKLTNHLLFKTRIAIQRIKTTTSYKETEKFNNPLRLIFKGY